MKRFVCQSCQNGFNFPIVPQFCPFCGGNDIVSYESLNGRKTALKMVEEYKGILLKLNEFADEYQRLTNRAKEIRKALATYKHKQIITEDDLPYTKNESLSSQIKKL